MGSPREAAHDARLVQRFKQGDETAFVEIVYRYRARMFFVAFNLLGDRGDAEEIVQDTFIRAHRALVHFRGDSSLVTWLHRITVNLTHNRYWHFFRRFRYVTVSLDAPISDGEGAMTLMTLIDGGSPSPAGEFAHADFEALIHQCMMQLEPRQRDVLVLRNVMNRSYLQIARLLSLNLGTVKSRIARARKILRLRIGESCPEFSSNPAPKQRSGPSGNGRLREVLRG